MAWIDRNGDQAGMAMMFVGITAGITAMYLAMLQ